MIFHVSLTVTGVGMGVGARVDVGILVGIGVGTGSSSGAVHPTAPTMSASSNNAATVIASSFIPPIFLNTSHPQTCEPIARPNLAFCKYPACYRHSLKYSNTVTLSVLSISLNFVTSLVSGICLVFVTTLIGGVTA